MTRLEEIKQRVANCSTSVSVVDVRYLLRRLEAAEAVIWAERPWLGSDKIAVFEAAWTKAKEEA